MNALLNGPLIGGLPAMDFFRRQIKVKWKDKDQHPSTATMVGIGSRGRIKVKYGPANRQTAEVEAHLICPFWSRNPDLLAKAQELGLQVEPEVCSEPVSPEAPSPPMSTPVTPPPAKQVAAAARKIKGIKAGIEIGSDWMGTYQELQKVMAGIGAKKSLMERIQREVAEEDQMIALYLEELEKKGVQLEWEPA